MFFDKVLEEPDQKRDSVESVKYNILFSCTYNYTVGRFCSGSGFVPLRTQEQENSNPDRTEGPRSETLVFNTIYLCSVLEGPLTWWILVRSVPYSPLFWEAEPPEVPEPAQATYTKILKG